MPAHSTAQPQLSDWWQSLMITVATFLTLACPMALTCIPSELIRAEWTCKKRIIDCQLSPDKSEVVVVVAIHSQRSLPPKVRAPAVHVTSCEHKVVACKLTSPSTPSRLLLEYPCVDCWGWIDQRGTLLMSNDRGQLLSYRMGSVAQGPNPLMKLDSLRDVQVSPRQDFCLINDNGRLSSYELKACDQLGQPVWTSPAKVEAFAWLPDAKHIVVAQYDRDIQQLQLVEAATGRELGLLATVPEQVQSILMLPRSKQILIVCAQSAGLLPWPITSALVTNRFVPWIRIGISRLAAIAPDERSVVTTSPDGSQLIVWDPREQKLMKTLDACRAVMIGAEFLDNHRLATWGSDNRLRIWNLESSQVEREIEL